MEERNDEEREGGGGRGLRESRTRMFAAKAVEMALIIETVVEHG